MTTSGPLPQQLPGPGLDGLGAGAIGLTGETCRLARRRQAAPAGSGDGLGAAARTARGLAGPDVRPAVAIGQLDRRIAGQLRGLAAGLTEAAGRCTGPGGHEMAACAAVSGRAVRAARARDAATAGAPCAGPPRAALASGRPQGGH